MRTTTMRWGLLCLLAIAGAGGRDARATSLRWKFKPGETLRYTMEQNTVTAVKAQGLDVKTTLTQTIAMRWIIKSVGDDGTADMTQTIDRVRTKIESAIGGFEYDSDAKEEPKGPVAATLVPLLKAMVHAEFSFKMSPLGELSDVRVPDQVTKALREAGPAGVGAGMFSEEGLKNMISESSLALPGDDVSKGYTWPRQNKIPTPPVGTMTLDKTYTYDGPDPKTGAHIEKIGLNTKISFMPTPESKINLTIKTQEGKGSFFFDQEAGRIVNSTVTQKLESVISVQEMEITQINDTSTTMKLAPNDAGSSK